MVKKKVRLSSHIHFLEKCYKQSLIPKGFSWKWRLNLDVDETFIKKIENIKRDASLKLMEISLKAYQEKLSECIDQIESIQNNDSINHCDESTHEISQMADADRKCKARKLKKLQDTAVLNEPYSAVSTQCDNKVFKEYRVKGDGNCFYLCLSKYLYGEETKHTQIRNNIVNYMDQNRHLYSQYVDGNMEDHLLVQRSTDGQSSSYATEAELFAAADRYRLNVLVKSSVQKDSGWNEHKPTVKGRGCREIRLLHKNEHFNLLEVSGKEEMQIEEKTETRVRLGGREADVQKIGFSIWLPEFD